MKSNEELTQQINGIIEKNNDAHLGYIKAAENAVNPRLRIFLQKLSDTRCNFADDLKNELQNQAPAANIDADGSITGGLHRFWMDIKSMTKQDDEAMLAECLRGEAASREEYKEVLADVQNLPTNLAEMLKKQSIEMYDEVHKISRLEDLGQYF